MKKTMMAIAAAMMMSASMMAQNEQPQAQQAPQMDRAEMLKARTEQMVKDYGLNEEQAKKLEALNTEYAEKIPMMPMMRGQRGQGQRPQGQMGQGQRPQGQMGQGQRPQRQPGDSTRRGQRPQMGQMGQMGQGQRPQMNFEEMRKNMEAYNAELEKIMTQEQYAKYRESMGRRMGGGQRGQGGFGGGNRPQRNNQ
jgi:hypothetical protein